MKVGIYIDGLGQSVAEENAVSYATRLTKELNNHNNGVTFDLKVERIRYLKEHDTNVIHIVQIDKKKETIIYKLYEFNYSEMLTKDFNNKNILYKNYLLFSIVFKKFPLLIKRIIVPFKEYNFTVQTLYIFSIFFIIALAILAMVPSTIAVLSGFSIPETVVNFIKSYNWMLYIAKAIKEILLKFEGFSQNFISIMAIILLVIPKANTLITQLASEFVSAHLYLQFGNKKQDIFGMLDDLYEYIAENETDLKVHFHSYSFGTLIAMDYLFPYGNEISGNKLNYTEGLITIGSPFDFINSYYPNHYLERSSLLETKNFKWINVYSIADALGSNFRKDSNKGEATYGIDKNKLKPINLNYEVANLKSFGLFNFMQFDNIKIHGMYWSKSTDGNSCLNPIYLKMIELEFISVLK